MARNPLGALVGDGASDEELAALAARVERLADGDSVGAESGGGVALPTDADGPVGDLAAAVADLAAERDDAREAAERERERRATVETTADEYADAMTAVAGGDLTVRLDGSAESDSLARFAAAFDEHVGELEGTFETLKRFSGDVATYSNEVAASMDTVREGGERVDDVLDSISQTTTEQSSRMQSVTAETESLSTTIEEITSTANEVASTAERTAEAGDRGREAAERASESLRDIEGRTAEAVEVISGLQSEVEDIQGLVSTIQEIAHRTNILALNANIEASRSGAGDGGEGDEGFAVVAKEVKDLAERTESTAEDVEDRIGRVASEADDAVAAIRRTRRSVTEDAEEVEAAIDALDEIAAFAQQTNAGVQEITDATRQQAQSTQEVVSQAETVSNGAEAAAARSDRAARRAGANANALEHVAASATRLTDQSRELLVELQSYETGEAFELPEAHVDDANAAAVSAGRAEPEASD